MTIEFFVEGEAKAQPRPRAFARRFKNGAVAARVYDAGTAEAWKSQVAIAIRVKRPAQPIAGPIRLVAAFIFKRPKSHFGSGRNADQLKSAAPWSHTSKPDLDNLIKAVKDCLTTIGVWNDDSQVIEESVSKRWCGRDEKCGAMIQIHYGELRA